MASKAVSNPFIRHVAKRGYAQASACIKEHKIQCSIMPNKTVLAALDNGSPVTRVTVAFKAGSRYEPQAELGLSHVLRSCAGLSTGNASGFIIARKLAQIGANFTASGDREFIYYTLEATQENLSAALECLNNIISNQEFRPWELADNAPRLKYDILALPPQVRAMDLLHRAAYRRQLGNSLFISPRRIGSVSSESLQHYACNNLLPARCAVAVVGDTQEKAILVAQALQLSANNDYPLEPSKYFSGEARKEMGGDLAHIALAVEGAPAGSKDALAFAVAAKALGNGPVTKWGTDNSCLARSIGNIGPFAAAGFNASYTDSGLFGAVLSVPKDEACVAVKAVAGLLRCARMSSENIKAAKNQLLTQVLSEADQGSNLSESLAAQSLYSGCAKTPGHLANDIVNLSENDVNAVLTKAASLKMSMGAVGNLAHLPYVDEL